MTSPSDSGLDPAVRARLERLVAAAGPRRALPGGGSTVVSPAPAATAGSALVGGRPAPSARSVGPGAAAVGVPVGPDGGSGELAEEAAVQGRHPLLGALRLTRHHAWALALLVLVGMVASTAWSLRARAVDVAPPVPVTPVPVSAMPTATNTTPSPTPAPAVVVVHVLGAVVRPGVVSVPAPARVRDVIAAAGGFRPDADPSELNLAALISDGAQIVVGTTGQPRGEVRGGTQQSGQSGGTAGPGDTLLDLNTATVDQLDQLPGVGPVTAQAILAWRAKHGRFSKVEELQEVDGIGPKTYAQIAPHVRV